MKQVNGRKSHER